MFYHPHLDFLNFLPFYRSSFCSDLDMVVIYSMWVRVKIYTLVARIMTEMTPHFNIFNLPAQFSHPPSYSPSPLSLPTHTQNEVN